MCLPIDCSLCTSHWSSPRSIAFINGWVSSMLERLYKMRTCVKGWEEQKLSWLRVSLKLCAAGRFELLPHHRAISPQAKLTALGVSLLVHSGRQRDVVKLLLTWTFYSNNSDRVVLQCFLVFVVKCHMICLWWPWIEVTHSQTQVRASAAMLANQTRKTQASKPKVKFRWSKWMSATADIPCRQLSSMQEPALACLDVCRWNGLLTS